MALNDLLFGADLIITRTNVPPPLPPTLALNEISSVTNAQFWVEILNYGSDPVNLNNNVLERFGNTTNIEFVIPSQTLPPGGRLVLDRATVGFGADPGDKIVLYGLNKTNVLDGAITKSYLQGRWPEGTGEWFHPSGPTPGDTNTFSFHNEMVINEIMYSHRRLPPVAEVRFTNVLITLTNFWHYDQNGLHREPPGAPRSSMIPAGRIPKRSFRPAFSSICPFREIRSCSRPRTASTSSRIISELRSWSRT